ncbi:MAG: undecaprenyl-phosphate glucose phosphotransferase [Pseudomonadota bacterium]
MRLQKEFPHQALASPAQTLRAVRKRARGITRSASLDPVFAGDRAASFAKSIAVNRHRARKGVFANPFYALVVFSLVEAAMLAVLSGALATLSFDIQSAAFTRHSLAGALVAGIYLFLQLFCGLGDPQWLTKLRARAMKSLQLFAIAASALLIMAFALKISEDFSRAWTGRFVVLGALTVLISHVVVRVTRKSFLDTLAGERVALYSFTADSLEIARQFVEPSSLYRLVGIYDDRSARRPETCAALPCEGSLQNLIEDAQAGLIDSVVICLDIRAKERVRYLMRKLSAASVNVSFAPLLHFEETLSLNPRPMGGMLVADLAQRPLSRWAGMTKWLEDKLIACLGLVVLAPVMLVIAALIKLTSAGPVFFRQQRFGFNNRPFYLFKFRSMYVEQQDVSGALSTQRGDQRVTPIGRILRRTSLDEIPQLFNVLRGEMSIVGPRPHALEMRVNDALYHERYSDYASRHRVKPGLTGWAQINGSRGEVDTHEKARRRILLDLYYIRNWSLALDLWIMVCTAVTVITNRDAY